MKDDVLGKVIAVEKEIQDCLEAEKAKARQWLEGVKKETDEELTKAEEGIGNALRESEEKARREVIAEAEVILREAADRAERILKLSDETLTGIIMRRLRMILPQ